VAFVVPPGFDVASCKNKEERAAIDALLTTLSDDWIVVPNFLFRHDYVDGESDIILLHPRHGLALLEVKGGRISIEKGVWVGTDKDPVAQLRRNTYAIRDALREVTGLKYLEIRAGIWLPAVKSVPKKMPAGLSHEQILCLADLANPLPAILELCSHPYAPSPLEPDAITAIIGYLAPDVTLDYDETALANVVHDHLRAICDAQVSTLACLDVHPRVIVTGRAGTGKTYLASTWMMRGLNYELDERPPRVLLTCYNDPLATKLQENVHQLYGGDEETLDRLRVGAFLRTMLTLEGMPGLKVREDDPEFWNVTVPAHLMANWHLVQERFDRIIVDEAQDFSPAWLGLLESLLDPDGENAFFLLADPHQEIVDRGFVVPPIAAGWVHGELLFNVRSTRDIARVARRYLDGSAGAQRLPASDGVQGFVAPKTPDVVRTVAQCLATITGEGVSARDILVVASDRETRDHLRATLGLAVHGKARPGQVVCETPRRSKGLEYDVVIVAVSPKGMTKDELYVAVTRAIRSLIVIGPEATLGAIGL
jgi:hypothetical protein